MSNKKNIQVLPQPKQFFAQRFALWIAMCSMFMLFAGFTSAYLVRRADKNWLEFDLPIQFTISTVVVVLSSFTIAIAHHHYKKDNYKLFRLFLITTTILGIVFSFLQISGWNALKNNGIDFLDKGSEISASFLYVISGAHLLHLLGGVIFLLIACYRSFFIFKKDPTIALVKDFQPSKGIRMDLLSTYWHFVDVLWVYLFIFFIINH